MFSIGIDEAGRGPWAGPVFAAIVILDESQSQLLIKAGVKDSKKISDKKRQELYKLILENSHYSSVKFYSSDIIDEFSIYKTTQLLIKELSADPKFQQKVERLNIRNPEIQIDGLFPGLKLIYQHKCIIHGDDLEVSISSASILAKVRRDKYMLDLHEKFPQYGFDKHKGYGTALHQKNILEHGLINEHRKSFKPIAKLAERE